MESPENGQTTDERRVDGPRLIIIGLILIILLLFGLLLAQCGDGAENDHNSDQETQVGTADASSSTEPPTTTVLASTATQTPTTVASSTSTTEAPATTSTTEAPQPVFDCTLSVEDGGLAGLNKDEDPTDVTTAVAAITDLCGAPDSDTGWQHQCLLDVPPDQLSDEKPLRIVSWGGLDLTFRRGYEVDWIEPPTVDEQGYPIVSPAEPSYGPAVYTDSGFLAKWNYYGLGSDGKQVQLTLEGGSIGDPMADVMATLSLSVDDIDEWAYEAFGRIVVNGPDGVYSSQIEAWDDDVAAAIENSVLTSFGWIQYCH
ncbi:MAG: hypothetical protein P8J50_19130 [Acidimicrobiales bacterium]|nr:hypothetical protein [Acidimicrobiales bacterium]